MSINKNIKSVRGSYGSIHLLRRHSPRTNPRPLIPVDGQQAIFYHHVNKDTKSVRGECFSKKNVSNHTNYHTLNWITHLAAFFFLTCTLIHARECVIVLDPAGDAKVSGRQLDDSFERGVTLQCVQELQKVVQERFPKVRVALTRLPGEMVYELQNAQFTNRLNADVYISIHFFHEHETLPRWYLYTYKQYDDCILKPQTLSFYRYDQAHLINASITKKWSTACWQLLDQQPYKKQFHCVGLFSIPCNPLVGIKAPAFMFEIGLKHKDAWKGCVDPLVACINLICGMWEKS